MQSRTTLTILVSLIAVHIVLAAIFAYSTPFRTAGAVVSQGARANDIGAPDERQQVNYVLRLANGRGFPVFNPLSPNLYEEYESHQPPLFYVLDAVWGKVTGASLPAPPPTPAPEMSKVDGLRLRSLNFLIGGVTVAGVFYLALWGYRRPEVALTAAAFAALLPMNAALSGAVSNDPLLVCLCTWALAFAVLGMRDGWTTKRALAVGVLAGLAILTKTTGVALLPTLLIAALWREVPRPTPRQWLAVLIPLVLIVLPWWIRNQSLYGDPMALRAFNQAFTGSKQASEIIARAGPFAYWVDGVALWTAQSFVGVFGYMDIWLTDTTTQLGNDSIYKLAWLLMAVALVGWVLSLRNARAEKSAGVHWVDGVFFLVVLVLFIRFNAQYFQAQGRYLLPALGPISVGIGLGLAQLAKDRWRLALSSVILVFGIADTFAAAKLPAAFQTRVELGTGNTR